MGRKQPTLVSAPEMAETLGVKLPTLRAWLRKRMLPVHSKTPGGQYRLDPKEVKATYDSLTRADN